MTLVDLYVAIMGFVIVFLGLALYAKEAEIAELKCRVR